MARVQNGVETSPKILTVRVGCTNVTGDRRRQTSGGCVIAYAVVKPILCSRISLEFVRTKVIISTSLLLCKVCGVRIYKASVNSCNGTT